MSGRRVVALVPDLMDRSRVNAAAAATGTEVRYVNGTAGLVEIVAEVDADVVIVDLARPGVLEAIAALAARGTPTIGFGAHVDAGQLEAARAAGCAAALARSAFFGRLPELLAQ
jgi:AmiR/NasT family two-component response regulator